jgi:hypothetical protein
VTGIAFTDHALLACDGSNSIFIWDLAETPSATKLPASRVLSATEGCLQATGTRDSSLVAAVSRSGVLFVWDMAKAGRGAEDGFNPNHTVRGKSVRAAQPLGKGRLVIGMGPAAQVQFQEISLDDQQIADGGGSSEPKPKKPKRSVTAVTAAPARVAIASGDGAAEPGLQPVESTNARRAEVQALLGHATQPTPSSEGTLEKLRAALDSGREPQLVEVLRIADRRAIGSACKAIAGPQALRVVKTALTLFPKDPGGTLATAEWVRQLVRHHSNFLAHHKKSFRTLLEPVKVLAEAQLAAQQPVLEVQGRLRVLAYQARQRGEAQAAGVVETAEPEEMDELDSLPGSDDDASDGMASEDEE